MMRRGFVLVLAAAAAMVFMPADGSAQGRGNTPDRVAKGPPNGWDRGQSNRWGRDQDRSLDPRQDREPDDAWGRDNDSDRDGGWGRDSDRDRDGRLERRRGDVRRGKGPAFCRSGAGHPVFGRRWCRDKGFGLGDRWERDRQRDSLEDIIDGIPRRDPREANRNRATVIDILEDVLGNR